MVLYFLRRDYDALLEQIQQGQTKMREIGTDIGESCRQSGETTHDNFPYEEAIRQQQMASTRTRDLIRVKEHARIVQVTPGPAASIGKVVTYKDTGNGETHTLKIGSHMTFGSNTDDVVAYNAPLAKIFIGKKAGDECHGKIAGVTHEFLILEVSTPTP